MLDDFDHIKLYNINGLYWKAIPHFEGLKFKTYATKQYLLYFTK